MMSEVSDHDEENEITTDARIGKAISKGVSIGFPVSIVFLTVVVNLITDLDRGDSFATALLPGVLLGGFGGGFVGLARTME